MLLLVGVNGLLFSHFSMTILANFSHFLAILRPFLTNFGTIKSILGPFHTLLEPFPAILRTFYYQFCHFCIKFEAIFGTFQWQILQEIDKRVFFTVLCSETSFLKKEASFSGHFWPFCGHLSGHFGTISCHFRQLWMQKMKFFSLIVKICKKKSCPFQETLI